MYARDERIIKPDNWINPSEPVLEEETPEEEIKIEATDENINNDFIGIINLDHKTEDKDYSAELTLDCGKIIAASFHDKKTDDLHVRKEAVDKINKKLKGTKGRLRVKHLNPKQIHKHKTKNKEKLLDDPIPFSDLDLRITLNPEKKHKALTYLDKIAKKYNLWNVDYDREKDIVPTIYRENGEIVPIPETEEELNRSVVDEMLAKQINGFVAQRKKRLEKFAGTPRETEILEYIDTRLTNTTGGPKVETSIDLLYNLVQQYDRLRLNEVLAEKLNISHPHLIRWAHILEKKGLVQVRYPFTGNPEIKKINAKARVRIRLPEDSLSA